MKLAWSHLAVEELRAIRRYSVERWGGEIAQRYLSDLRAAARLAAADPGRARRLNDSFRLVRVRSHYLIVQCDEAAGRLTVARVLHGAMDLERHLPSD